MDAQPIWNTELTQEGPDYNDDVFGLFLLGTPYKSTIRETFCLDRTVVVRSS